MVDEEKTTPLSPVEISQSAQGQSQITQSQSAVSTGQVGCVILWKKARNVERSLISFRGL